MWIKHRGSLFNLETGTQIMLFEGVNAKAVRICPPGNNGFVSIDCSSMEEAKALFKDIACKVLPEDHF